jgi:hypothetical protein
MSQVEICFNAVRMDPLKYKQAYSCNYDTDIAPKLVTGGRRVPLYRADSAATAAADRFDQTLLTVTPAFEFLKKFLCWNKDVIYKEGHR